jgi:hypothetical protein
MNDNVRADQCDGPIDPHWFPFVGIDQCVGPCRPASTHVVIIDMRR